MTKNTTRKALLMSILSLMLCFSMLIGTTFAWFTDTVTSAGNIIKTGKLDVELHWADGAKAVPTAEADWADASTGAIFDYDNWEPGYVQVRHIKIANKGTLAFKYKVSIIANGEVSDLSDVIDVYYVDPAQQVVDRAALANLPKLGTLTEVLAKLGETGNGTLEKGDSDVITIAFKMQETAGNEYQEKSIGSDFSVQLLATQLAFEGDSFDNKYDTDADYVTEVKTADDLAVALKAGGLVRLANDISTTETITVPAGVAVELDLNGKTITGTKGRDAENNRVHVLVNNGILTINGGTVKSGGNDGGSAIYNNAGASLIINDVTLYGAPQSDPVYEAGVSKPYPSYAFNNYGTAVINGATIKSYHGAVATGDNGSTIINDADIDVGLGQSTGITSYLIYSYGDAQVTVNGGNFAFTKQEIYVNGGNTFCELGTNPIIVNGGNYIGTSFSTGDGREYVINGGTFDKDPTAYVADGYQVVDNGDGTFTVKPYEVSSTTEFQNAIANGKAVILTADLDVGKIDLTNSVTNDVVIDANGHKITTTESYGIEATPGKNITISNADVEITKDGDYITYAAGFKVANGDYAGATITLKNCTISMANGDWSYAVNMPASVKNLNLVIDNCTLEGAIAVQCWGDNNTIKISNSKLICNYTTSALYTSYCVALQSDGSSVSENNTLVISNCEFLYSGIDNFNSPIYSVKDYGNGNTVTVTDCIYGDKIVAE